MTDTPPSGIVFPPREKTGYRLFPGRQPVIIPKGVKQMKRSLLFLAWMVTAAGSLLAQPQPAPVYGNYQGGFRGIWEDRTLRAQVVGEGGDTYRAVLYVAPKDGQETRTEVRGKTARGVTHFEGPVDLGAALGGSFTISGDISKGVFAGFFKSASTEAKFELQRVLIQSPTLGMKPPEGAIVLMDGTQETIDKHWNVMPRWILQGDGSLRAEFSSIWTKQAFGDGEYHVEFKTPYMPYERDQGRGNSGVYILGRYEIQVLDSFADEPANNRCGGIYQQATPLVNACLPPEEWQTYDITFRGPKFDPNGKKVKDAEITVKHNGIIIHDQVTLKHPTPGGLDGREAPTGQILLQDHTNPVSYRNIWIKPLD